MLLNPHLQFYVVLIYCNINLFTFSIMKSVPASIPAIKELLVAGLGTKRNQPYIFVSTEHWL